MLIIMVLNIVCVATILLGLMPKSTFLRSLVNYEQNFQSFKYAERRLKPRMIHQLEKVYWYEMHSGLKSVILVCPLLGMVICGIFQTPFSFLVSAIVSFILPAFIIDYRKKTINHSINQDMFAFLSRINAQLSQNNDFIDTLRTVERKVQNQFIQNGLRHFNTSIRAGLTPELAFNQLQSKTHHTFLKYLYINVEQAYTRRGDVVELMRGLENEYTSVQIEMNKRDIELIKYRDKTYFSILLVLLTGLKIVTQDDYLLDFYFSNKVGNFSLVFLILGFTLGAVLIVKAVRQGGGY
jgi:Flp pilus assembly protein TadB